MNSVNLSETMSHRESQENKDPAAIVPRYVPAEEL